MSILRNSSNTLSKICCTQNSVLSHFNCPIVNLISLCSFPFLCKCALVLFFKLWFWRYLPGTIISFRTESKGSDSKWRNESCDMISYDCGLLIFKDSDLHWLLIKSPLIYTDSLVCQWTMTLGLSRLQWLCVRVTELRLVKTYYYYYLILITLTV